MTTRIGLFGGSFNPPHIAHELVALYVLETQPVDELWFVPTYQHPFGKELAPYADRVAMCELIARGLGPRARVSRAEETLALRPGFVASRTLDLIEHVAAEAPELELRLIIGGDILGETAKWYRWDAVVARAPLIVIGRAGHPLEPGSSATGVVMPEISSTRIRELLAARDPSPTSPTSRTSPAGPGPAGVLSQLLPKDVLGYIAERGLYTTLIAHPNVP